MAGTSYSHVLGGLYPGHMSAIPGISPQVTATNVDIARVAPTYHLYTVEEVEAVISRL